MRNTWILYAHQYGDTFKHVGSKKWVELYPSNNPMVKVKVKIDENGDYYGWIDKGKEVPKMIFPNKMQFDICFPYGVEEAEKAGRGKAVRLKIEKG